MYSRSTELVASYELLAFSTLGPKCGSNAKSRTETQEEGEVERFQLHPLGHHLQYDAMKG